MAFIRLWRFFAWQILLTSVLPSMNPPCETVMLQNEDCQYACHPAPTFGPARLAHFQHKRQIDSATKAEVRLGPTLQSPSYVNTTEVYTTASATGAAANNTQPTTLNSTIPVSLHGTDHKSTTSDLGSQALYPSFSEPFSSDTASYDGKGNGASSASLHDEDDFGVTASCAVPNSSSLYHSQDSEPDKDQLTTMIMATTELMTVTMTKDTTSLSVSVITSIKVSTMHHSMSYTSTVTTTDSSAVGHVTSASAHATSSGPSSKPSAVAAASTTASPLHAAATNNEVPVAAIAVPVALVAAVLLLALPCCVRRFSPKLWASWNSRCPLEDLVAGLAAVWQRWKLVRARNRELRSKGFSGPGTGGGEALTGDGRMEEWWRGGAKSGEVVRDGGNGWLGAWRRRKEGELEAARERKMMEERWGLVTAAAEGGVGEGYAARVERVRGAELRRVKEGDGL
ncbi:uncharacterized protein HMPREF1541_02136 [Cyphellophora europaea CBS 101466]|uniref:Uncharacterized protein n=1 Tax=Cyphellophora europaea (strain CBS 101466) TaxID=1220924 RepID=W2S4K5_CYPE1|nr:uncharacterized protein HMPREF1541_02136 [Cyphellophora europaea CBS 101466]ETN42978.1 hypothetical protein HMPREF1541_02136 [Cyphellophora europaea CBS 101466]